MLLCIEQKVIKAFVYDQINTVFCTFLNYSAHQFRLRRASGRIVGIAQIDRIIFRRNIREQPLRDRKILALAEHMKVDFRACERSFVFREGRRCEQHTLRPEHCREPVEHIRRAVSAVNHVRRNPLRFRNSLPRRATERVGVMRAFIHSPVHCRTDRLRYAERIDICGKVDRLHTEFVHKSFYISAVTVGISHYITSEVSV